MSSKPVPVSEYPDEIICRRYRVTVELPALWDAPPLAVGSIVNVRRSPFASAARSYWLESDAGDLLATLTEASLRKYLEVIRT